MQVYACSPNLAHINLQQFGFHLQRKYKCLRINGIKFMVFWDMMPCSLEDRYQCLDGILSFPSAGQKLLLSTQKTEGAGSPQMLVPRLNSVTSHKTMLFNIHHYENLEFHMTRYYITEVCINNQKISTYMVSNLVYCYPKLSLKRTSIPTCSLGVGGSYFST